jgi:hypothetical protein
MEAEKVSTMYTMLMVTQGVPARAQAIPMPNTSMQLMIQ